MNYLDGYSISGLAGFRVSGKNILSSWSNTELQYMPLVYIVIIVLPRTVFDLKQFFRFSGKWNRMSKRLDIRWNPMLHKFIFYTATPLKILYCTSFWYRRSYWYLAPQPLDSLVWNSAPTIGSTEPSPDVFFYSYERYGRIYGVTVQPSHYRFWWTLLDRAVTPLNGL